MAKSNKQKVKECRQRSESNGFKRKEYNVADCEEAFTAAKKAIERINNKYIDVVMNRKTDKEKLIRESK